MNMTKRLIVCAAWIAAALGACGQEPVVWWDFDADSSTVNKGTGGPAYNPNFNGNISFEAGLDGQGIRLPGSAGGGRHNAAVAYDYGNTGSISLWFKPARYFDYNTVFDHSIDQDRWEMFIRYNGELGLGNFRETYLHYSLRNICRETNTWFHIVFTWDVDDTPYQTKFYINGSHCATSGHWREDPARPIPVGTTYFGGGNNGNPGGEGLMDEVKIYDVALSPEAIHAEWLAVTGADLAPVIHLPLQGDTANIGTGGAQYDGVVGGAPVYTTGPDGMPGHAIMMAGGNDCVAVPYVMPRSGTLSMWYRAAPFYYDGGRAIVDCCGLDNNTDYMLYHAYAGGNPSLQCRVVTGASGSWATVPMAWDRVAEPWRYVTGTWDANTGAVSMYVDGQLVDSRNYGYVFPVPGQSVYLAGGNPLKTDRGIFDAAGLQIYETCLPAGRVLELYEAATNNVCGQAQGTLILLK